MFLSVCLKSWSLLVSSFSFFKSATSFLASFRSSFSLACWSFKSSLALASLAASFPSFWSLASLLSPFLSFASLLSIPSLLSLASFFSSAFSVFSANSFCLSASLSSLSAVNSSSSIRSISFSSFSLLASMSCILSSASFFCRSSSIFCNLSYRSFISLFITWSNRSCRRFSFSAISGFTSFSSFCFSKFWSILFFICSSSFCSSFCFSIFSARFFLSSQFRSFFSCNLSCISCSWFFSFSALAIVSFMSCFSSLLSFEISLFISFSVGICKFIILLRVLLLPCMPSLSHTSK